jgi:hypothetical protein
MNEMVGSAGSATTGLRSKDAAAALIGTSSATATAASDPFNLFSEPPTEDFGA